MIDDDTVLTDQYIHILLMKQRLNLLTYTIAKKPLNSEKIMKLLMQLCQNLHLYQLREIVPTFKALYLQYNTALSNRYTIFYESLSSFFFGGANRKAIVNGLAILSDLMKSMRDRQDNALLS